MSRLDADERAELSRKVAAANRRTWSRPKG